ncbi:MAG: zinc dependent phospholipase C family protein [Chloroflexota bacterium]
MASWIVHLRIAEKILEEIPGLIPDQFAIGNVAPDSGVPDENWEIFDPPPTITHFQPEDETNEIRSEDLRFFREYLNSVSFENHPDRFSFLLGYYFHLVTDNFWGLDVYKPTKEKYKQQFADDPSFIWEVKKDWYGLDFSYVRSHPESLFWKIFLPAEYTTEFMDFFPKNAITQQLDYIKSYYQRRDDEVEASLRLNGNIYLSAPEMDQFVNISVQKLLSIFELIWIQKIPLSEYRSGMELLESL